MYQKLKDVFWQAPRWLQLSTLRIVRPGMVDSILSLRDPDEGEDIIRKFDNHKCIFVHIPKTGGISIKKSLFGIRGGAHRRLRNYKILYNEKEFSNYFKFSFVRNPWDRVVSAYEFLKAGGINEADRRWTEEVLSQFNSFNDFIVGWLAETEGYGEIHFMPQYEFICLGGTKPQVDYIGRFEQINKDFTKICNKIGVQKELSDNNKSSRHSDYKKYYTKETEEVVEEVYSEDIRMFGYSF
jgi:hypothetical protein